MRDRSLRVRGASYNTHSGKKACTQRDASTRRLCRHRFGRGLLRVDGVPDVSKVRLTLIVVAFVLQGVALWLLYLFAWDVVTRHKFVTVSVGFITHAASIVLLALTQYV